MSISMSNYTYPADPNHKSRARLRGLMQRASVASNHSESLRLAIFGDSTWTAPGGGGVYPMNYLTQQMGMLFGNIAGTQIGSVALTGVNCPYWRSGHNGSQTPHFGSDYWPPSLFMGGLPAIGEQPYAPWIMHDVGSASLPLGRKMFAGNKGIPNTNFRLEVLAVKRANSCPTLTIQNKPTDKAYSLFEALHSTQTITIPGIAENTPKPELVKVVSAPINPPGGKPRSVLSHWSGEATTNGSGSVSPLVLLGASILNENPVGALINSYSAGGYRTLSWLGDTVTGVGGVRNNAPDVVAQLEQDVWMFTLGANDHYNASSATDTCRNYYDPDGTSHKGLVGELIAKREARGLKVPLLIFTSTPFRANDGAPGYAANKAQHNLFFAALCTMADELIADGYDVIVRDTKAETDAIGFNAEINDYQDCTVKGAYDTGGIAYSVNDIVTGTDGVQYRTLVAHTSSATTEPTADGHNNGPVYHRPIHVHLSGNVSAGPTADPVHWSEAGSVAVVDSYMSLFREHFDPSAAIVDSATIAAIAAANLAALNSDETQTTARANAATAVGQTTTAAIKAGARAALNGRARNLGTGEDFDDVIWEDLP